MSMDHPALLTAARTLATDVLNDNWREDGGYTSPNLDTYPWQWLWDSCFHAIIWAALGDDRAVRELEAVFTHQDAVGFVPHMGYQLDPEVATPLWGRSGCSSISQPPMFGHALCELHRAGLPVGHLVERAVAGIAFFGEHRRTNTGLLRIVHPWESGADNTPRWDRFCPGGFDKARWMTAKIAMLDTISFGPTGAPLHNPAFDVAPVSFAALVAMNAADMGATFNVPELSNLAVELGDAVASTFDPSRGTWVDQLGDGAPAGDDDVIDALFGLFVDRRPEARATVADALTNEERLAAPFGPCAVSRSHPGFDPTGYWRGPQWPHLTYLLALACRAAGLDHEAALAEDGLLRGAVHSSFGEYIDPFTGGPLGAHPQSWTGLALVPAAHRDRSAR